MGIAASADSAPPDAAAPADPPAKEETQHAAAAAAAPLGSSAPAHPPAKEVTQLAAAAADAPGGDGEAVAETVVLDVAAEAGEDEGECRFCLFMKGGGCKEEFVGWEKCVEEAEVAGGDVVELCYEATAALRKCMDAHAEYYEPILRAERAMAKDLEAMGASETAETSSTSPPPAVAGEGGVEKKKADEETSEALETSSTSTPPAVAEEEGDEKNKAEEVVVKEKEKEGPAA